jgi:pimeloyl-ACP methyl ester carboxylesterase
MQFLADLESIWYGPSADSAPTLVFLHEGLGSASMWRDFPRRLSDATGYGALVYSRRGYGSSPPAALPRPIGYMHDEADVLAEVMRHHGVREAVVVGHSDGASIALIYAGRNTSGPLRALILEAPHVFVETLSVESIAAMKRAWESTDLRGRLVRHHRDADNAFRGWNDVWLDPGFRDWNIEELLTKIEAPMLLIQGSDDEYGTWKQVEAIERQVRGPVETLLVPGARHAAHRDQPELVLGKMADFVKRVRGGGGGR